ncbi:MAG: discoidin domain-containing protein [Verrucomicrobiales bacterium]
MHQSLHRPHLGWAATIVLLAAAPATLADTAKEDLKVQFPKAQFVGTPIPATGIKNLDKSGKPILTLSVAKGTVLLSKEKEVTSSETTPSIGDFSLVTDGDKDGADGSFVELGPGQQWVQIDLGAPTEISAIALWHFHKQARVYRDVVIELSDDPEFKTSTIIFNNDDDNSLGKGAGKDPAYVETNHGRLMSGKQTKAQYIRAWSNGNNVDDLNHYVELEVYGVPAK